MKKSKICKCKCCVYIPFSFYILCVISLCFITWFLILSIETLSSWKVSITRNLEKFILGVIFIILSVYKIFYGN